MEEAMEALVDGNVSPVQTAAFLAALRAKGETSKEIGGAVRLLLRKAHRVEAHRPLLMDNCGTGGDCKGTFNISTASAFVAAGGGIPMAKHGNRSVSSRCGSADVAEALGAEMPSTPGRAASCLDTAGLVLLFAPHFHPILRNVAEVRKALGVRTIFNILGPLLNPAPLTHQVMGVFDPDLGVLLAEVLRSLGRKGGMVISGHGGFDELSLSGPNRVAFFSEEGVKEALVTPEEAGLVRRDEDEVLGGDASQNASIIEDVLAGKKGAARDVVLLNAAAVFLASGRAARWKEGAAMAAESIDSGAAARVLEKIRSFSQQRGEVVLRSA
jgi:anthranilate phosphoribosyltransferase